VNYVNYVLSSFQSIEFPKIINHYIFVDPVYGLNIVYPDTVTGETFTTTVYPSTANGGLFFPWGYPVYNTVLSADLGLFKGQTTLTIVPSAIDNTYYTTLKIVYDFKEGEIINIEKGIVQNLLNLNIVSLDPGSPNDTNVSHIYTPISLLSSTFTPTITVLNGNMALNVFNLKLTLVPDSIFTFDDFHIVNTAQLTKDINDFTKSLEVIEIDNKDFSYLSNFVLLSSATSKALSSTDIIYYTPTPTPSFTPTQTPSPTPTPSVTPSFTPTPTVTNPAVLAVEFVTYE